MGWVAGGSAQPYSHTGAGVLLATRDGGQTWTANSSLMLPELNRILFTDPQHGWAIGFRSAMYRSGVFATDDGGRNWRPLFGSGDSLWLTGDFLNPSAGVLAGYHAEAATAGRGKIEPFRINQSGLQNLRQLRLAPPAHGWLVGDGGLLMLTGNSGAAWQAPAGSFPAEAARHFDFAALATRGAKAWIAGTPGARIFFTPDAGATWSSFSTGVSTPLSAMTFVDDEHGWAVGALGTILATSDGGRTWQRQRSGGTRSAILALFAQADDVPLELLARVSGNDGYLIAVEVLTRRDVEVRGDDDVPLAERLRQAVLSVGGSFADVAWQFPLRQKGVQLGEEHYRRTDFKSRSTSPRRRRKPIRPGYGCPGGTRCAPNTPLRPRPGDNQQHEFPGCGSTRSDHRQGRAAGRGQGGRSGLLSRANRRSGLDCLASQESLRTRGRRGGMVRSIYRPRSFPPGLVALWPTPLPSPAG